MSFSESVKFSWTRTLLILIRRLVHESEKGQMGTRSPVQLLGLPPVMETQHNGERAGRQLFLVLIVKEAVGCRQCKSVSNLWRKQKLFSTSYKNASLTSTAPHLPLM